MYAEKYNNKINRPSPNYYNYNEGDGKKSSDSSQTAYTKKNEKQKVWKQNKPNNFNN
jgi:hypothetical protein